MLTNQEKAFVKQTAKDYAIDYKTTEFIYIRSKIAKETYKPYDKSFYGKLEEYIANRNSS